MTKSAAEQQQFLNVIDRDEAERRWRAAFSIPQSDLTERIPLTEALGRVLGEDVVSQVDVPFFDRSNLDGFAVRAADTYGAEEETPVRLHLMEEVIATAVVPASQVQQGSAVTIATGGMVPRGADAIVMVEHTEVAGNDIVVFKPVTPGRGMTFAGTDIAKGETVYRQGDVITSRETGVLAAIGFSEVVVRRRPRVGIVSTGDEIIAPGEPMRAGLVYDSNAQVLADAVRELGGEPVRLGIVADDLQKLRDVVETALLQCDLVLLSGGTSKGAGDLCYQVVSEFSDPGIVAHGVALKPGKPICLAATRNIPVVILPGFPTSAIFTFHEFVASVIVEMAGRSDVRATQMQAQMAMQVNSEIGRTEFLLVGLVHRQGSPQVNPQVSHSANASDVTDGESNGGSGNSDVQSNEGHRIAAYPMGKGSGSVTTFALADGFVTIGRHEEIVEEGAVVNVTMLGNRREVADLVVIGSHCVGLDFLLSELQRRGLRTKFLAVGSTAGLRAIERGECDLAGIHLLDPETNQYNRSFLKPGLELLRGYQRQQGIVFRADDTRFAGKSVETILQSVIVQTDCVMVNRNQGSGTRILIDQLLKGSQPNGYAVQSRSHNAVTASVVQGRSDWGIAIEIAARQSGLGFAAVQAEEYDFVVCPERSSPAVQLVQQLLSDPAIRIQLQGLGLIVQR